MSDFGTSMGFRLNDNLDADIEKSKSIIQKELKRTFSPEFLNRLDAVVHFESLNKEHIRTIIDKQLEELASRIEKQGYQISVSDAVRRKLVEKSYSPSYGARPVARTIQNEIQDRITDLILSEELLPGATIHFSIKEGEIVAKTMPMMSFPIPKGKKKASKA